VNTCSQLGLPLCGHCVRGHKEEDCWIALYARIVKEETERFGLMIAVSNRLGPGCFGRKEPYTSYLRAGIKEVYPGREQTVDTILLLR
jgi:hypothetical protein